MDLNLVTKKITVDAKLIKRKKERDKNSSGLYYLLMFSFDFLYTAVNLI